MKILVAEDDPVTRRLLKLSLGRWQYEVALVTDGTQALEILLGEDAPRLAILDWVMPGVEGIEICRELRRRPQGSYTYALLLTSKSRKEDVLKGLEAGADDYLIKPFDLLELQARLWTGRRIIALQDQLIAAREEMRERATHDALTGVWNRASILEILKREINRSARKDGLLSCLMMDLDHFKRINDDFGHQAGDDVLRVVTRRVQSALRPYDSLGRYGGEEFVVVAPDCDKNSAFSLAERLRTAVNNAPVPSATGAIPVTLSLGVASLTEDSNSPESLLRSADKALYGAKSAGRDRSQAA
jgi:diguanylate cyclase (GGDEF)-like protein